MVLTAGRSDSTRAQDALARLCQTYWYPLYAYVRRRGYSPHDAEDLTQEFFARLLQANYLGSRSVGIFQPVPDQPNGDDAHGLENGAEIFGAGPVARRADTAQSVIGLYGKHALLDPVSLADKAG